MRVALLVHAAALFLASVSFANIKNMTPKNDDIIEIKTALGIATIIQIPDSVQSAVMGDQSAYRIEYVDQAVTIKPLRGGARTNLYLFTKERRYNLRLTVVPQNLAYYIVYIKKQDVGVGTRWVLNGKVASGDNFIFKLLRTGKTQDGFFLLDIEMKSKKSQRLDPGDFWIWQGRESKPMQSLFISRTELKKDQLVFLGISIRRAELKNQPLILELKTSPKPLRIEVPKEVLWN